MELNTLDDLDVAGRRVLVRADLNVPLTSEGEIADDFRIRSSLPTIQELLKKGAERIIILSHLGRPKGQVNMKFTLAPVAQRLSELLGEVVPLSPLPPGVPNQDARVTLVENVRFNPGETKGDEAFAKDLAARADVFVSDAFGAVHRSHSSVSGVAAFLPAAAGRLVEREVAILSDLMRNPKRPYVAVIGGAKVSDKLAVLDRLVDLSDVVCIGGAMCFTFLLAQGREIGKSLAEPDRVDDVLQLLNRAGEKLRLPVDFLTATTMDAQAEVHTVTSSRIPEGEAGFDIGPVTAQMYADQVSLAGTVMWNGPMGVFEIEPFAQGTRTVAQAVANAGGFTVVGGGDSVAAIEQMGFGDKVDHTSTGGGAMLELLEGKTLPGLKVLTRS